MKIKPLLKSYQEIRAAVSNQNCCYAFLNRQIHNRNWFEYKDMFESFNCSSYRVPIVCLCCFHCLWLWLIRPRVSDFTWRIDDDIMSVPMFLKKKKKSFYIGWVYIQPSATWLCCSCTLNNVKLSQVCNSISCSEDIYRFICMFNREMRFSEPESNNIKASKYIQDTFVVYLYALLRSIW